MDINEYINTIVSEMASKFGSENEARIFAECTIGNILESNGYICLDANDVLYTIKDAEKADIKTGTCDIDDIYNLCTSLHEEMLKEHEPLLTQSILLFLQFNREKCKFTIDKTQYLTKFFEPMPEDINIVWGVGFDDDLDGDVRITIIEGFTAQ